MLLSTGCARTTGISLTTRQRGDLKRRLDAARRAAFDTLGPAYTVALRVHGQEVEVCSLSDARHGFREHLGYLWSTLVEDEEWILRRVGSVTLDNTGLIPKEGGLRLKEAVEAFLRFTDKPMVATQEAVTSGLTQACADGLIGVGRGGSPSSLLTQYCKRSISLDPSEDGVWIIPPFDPEPETRSEDERASGTGVPGRGSDEGHGTGLEPRAGSAGDSGELSSGEETSDKRAVRRFVVEGEVPVESWSELFRCFVGPAAQMRLKKLGLGVRFEMAISDDDPLSENDSALKGMKEAARQLGLQLRIEK